MGTISTSSNEIGEGNLIRLRRQVSWPEPTLLAPAHDLQLNRRNYEVGVDSCVGREYR